MKPSIARWLIAIVILASLFLAACTDLTAINPVADSDGDGWTDTQEATAGTNPNSVDSDDDGYWDPLDPNPLDPTIPGQKATATATDTATSQTWDKKFGGSASDIGYVVQPTADGGYIIAGKTESQGAGGSAVWLIKTGSRGNETWNRTFGGMVDAAGYSVQQTSDGGYIVVGDTAYSGRPDTDIYLIKVDSAGQEQWSRRFGGFGNERGRWVRQTPDGGYIIAGDTTSSGAGKADVWLIKTDSLGNEQWSRTFGGDSDDHGCSVQPVSGGYIIGGDTASSGAGRADVWVIRTDPSGMEQWSHTFGGPDDDRAHSVQPTLDGGYIVVADTESYGKGASDAWLIKLDSEGNREWDNALGGANRDSGSSVQETPDSGYIVAGATESSGSGGRDVWLIKVDSQGNKVWDRTFGGTSDDIGFSVGLTADRGYIVAGVTGFDYAGGDVWLVWIAR